MCRFNLSVIINYRKIISKSFSNIEDNFVRIIREKIRKIDISFSFYVIVRTKTIE